VRWPIPIVVCSVVLVLSASPASADVIHGRGLHAEAEFDAGVFGHGHRSVTVLDQLCGNPDRQRHCDPIRPALQRAITKAADRPIEWVHRANHGVVWVLAPLRFGTQTAKVGWAWRDLRPDGCFGGGRLTYARNHGAWKLTMGIGYEGCPASGGG
jgi:hypothetical protein